MTDVAILRRLAGEQREMVRWWAAECRARNAACRRRFSAAHVAAATAARATLRHYAAAWSETRRLLRETGPQPIEEATLTRCNVGLFDPAQRLR
jgi:hypothetical protein